MAPTKRTQGLDRPSTHVNAAHSLVTQDTGCIIPMLLLLYLQRNPWEPLTTVPQGHLSSVLTPPVSSAHVPICKAQTEDLAWVTELRLRHWP